MIRAKARVLGLLAFVLLSWLPTHSARAQDSVHEAVYSGSVYDGVQYISVFYPAEQDTLYLLENSENALALKSTFVYFWETTGEYMADWSSENAQLDGDLEIYCGNNLVLRTRLVPCVLVRQRGETLISELLFGDAALERYQSYLDDVRRYEAEYKSYSTADQQYQQELWDRFQHPERYEDAAPLVEPAPPDPVSEYVTEPALGYHVSLPAGTYRLRVVDDGGNIVQRSEKSLKVFGHRREGISYVAYTDHRWTDQKISREAEDVIYTGEAAALFLRPFVQYEYYASDYWNLKEPQKVHDKLDSWMWVDIRPYDSGRLRVKEADGETEEVHYGAFCVEQEPGDTRGYRIVDVDASNPQAQMSFEAFKIDLTDGAPDSIALLEGEQELSGSQRRVRKIGPTSLLWVAVPALAVLLAGVVLNYVRRRATRL